MELVHSSKDKKEARSQYTGECMRSQAVACSNTVVGASSARRAQRLCCSSSSYVVLQVSWTAPTLLRVQ
eukprot:4029-Heterococcus_DN1.PRE.5